MYRAGYIGAKHTSIDNIPKGFPEAVRKQVRKETERLINKFWIIAKPTSYGEEVALNPRLIAEIKKITEEPLSKS